MYVFLSFRDAALNQSLGCVIVEADDEESAVQRTEELGLTPKPTSQVMDIMTFEIEPDDEDLQLMQLNKLYSSDEMYALGYKTIKDISEETRN